MWLLTGPFELGEPVVRGRETRAQQTRVGATKTGAVVMRRDPRNRREVFILGCGAFPPLLFFVGGDDIPTSDL